VPEQPPFRIRTAVRADHATIRDILRGAYRQYAAEVPPGTWERFLADLLDLDRHARHGQLLVAEVGGEVVGYVSFYPDLAAQGTGWPPGWAGGRGLAVRPGHRGCGIGPRLFAELEARALAGGAATFALHTSSFMTTAIALYERLGYRRAPQYDLDMNAHYGVTAARPWTAVAYVRALSVPARAA
jgi:predicted N-acetyltransferase YhbS